MAKQSKPKEKENKTARITIRVTPTEDTEIRKRAAARNLELSEFLVAPALGRGAACNWISATEWRQVAIFCEAYGRVLVLAVTHASKMPDPHAREMLEELVANSGRNQAYLEVIIDAIHGSLLRHEEEINRKAANSTPTGDQSP